MAQAPARGASTRPSRHPCAFGSIPSKTWNNQVLFRCRPLVHAVRMASLRQKIAAEQDTRAMLEDHGFEQPNAVEYGHTCIRLFWYEPRVVLIVDIDEPPAGVQFDDAGAKSQPG